MYCFTSTESYYPIKGYCVFAEDYFKKHNFIKACDLQIHYIRMGQGDPALLLLHGFGANTYTWRKVIEPLSEYTTVIAYDRPAFGFTDRPKRSEWKGSNPYAPEMQPEIVVSLLDALSIDQAILVGNSAGGTITLQTAYRYPEKVNGLVLVDAAIYNTGGTPWWARPIIQAFKHIPLSPKLIRPLLPAGDRALRLAWHDPSKIENGVIDGYATSWQVPGWDQAMWEMVLATGPIDIAWLPNRIKKPTLVITGDNDRIVPTRESIRLAEEIADAELVIIPECGHMPQEECPEQFSEAVLNFLARLM